MIRLLTAALVFVAFNSSAYAQAKPVLTKNEAQKLKDAIDRLIETSSGGESNNGTSNALRATIHNGGMIFLLREGPQNGGIIIFSLSNAETQPLGNGSTGILRLNTQSMANVYEVVQVDGRLSDKQFTIAAHGKVPTTGWTDATLVPVIYVQPPVDGIYDFSFVAEKPREFSAQIVTPISTKELGFPFSEGMKGVRVTAERNEYVLRFAQVVKGDLPKPIDEFKFGKATASKKNIDVAVEFGGGCARHDFELVWNSTYLESNPPVAVMRLVHNANGDACEGLVRETLHFALPEMDPCIVRIEDGSGKRVEIRHGLAN